MYSDRPSRVVKKIRRETDATETDIDAALQPEDTFEQVIGGYPEHSEDASAASDASDYFGRRRKQPARKRRRKQAKAVSRKLTMSRPSIPDLPAVESISDNEYSSGPDVGYAAHWLKPRPRAPIAPGYKQGHCSKASVNFTEVSKQDRSLPNVLQIHVNAGSGNCGSTINVDLTPLLNAYHAGTTGSVTPDADEALPGDGQPVIPADSAELTPSLRVQRLQEASARVNAVQKAKTSFTDLPPEIRIRIYRSVFVTEAPINFHSRRDFQRSSSFLRTCQIAHNEGRAVLYGENAFHFERSHSTRGKFFEEDWREIGFKDMRRFLETIGPTNISMMRYISIEFGDATKAYGPVEEIERRFVNDPVVLRCLELIGSNTHLAKFAVQFAGRRNLDRTDLPFLRALTSIKSQEVINVANYSGGYKVKPELLADVKKLMVVPRDDPDMVDEKKKRPPTVVMHHERNRGTRFFSMEWR